MILQKWRDRLLVVRQADHAAQAGLLASHWGNGQVPAFEPREPVIAAAVLHDNGWEEWEERPLLDPGTGQPRQFYQLAAQDHISLYRRGVRMAAAHHPLTGLLVSMHAAGLHNDRYGTFHLPERQRSPAEQEAVRDFLAEQDRLQQALAGKIPGLRTPIHVTAEPAIWYAYLLLQVWDRLSLQYAFRLAAGGEMAPLPRPDGSSSVLRLQQHGEWSLLMDPYPFDSCPCVFPLRARLLPDKRYRDPDAFTAEMAQAEEIVLECRADRFSEAGA